MKAFPSTEPIYGNEIVGVKQSTGMDLRDYFAAKAMQAMANDALGQDNDKLWEQELKELAEMSYSVANAMMKARNDS
jgi:hypothetical protein